MLGQQQVQRPLRPKDPRQDLRRPRAGAKPHHHIGKPDRGIRRGQTRMRGQRKLDPGAMGQTMQHGNNRLGAVFDLAAQRGGTGCGKARLSLAQVKTRGQSTRRGLAQTGQQDGDGVGIRDRL